MAGGCGGEEGEGERRRARKKEMLTFARLQPENGVAMVTGRDGYLDAEGN